MSPDDPPIGDYLPQATAPARPGGRGPLVVTLLILVIMWGSFMYFRWELRAQWWAFQVAKAESREQRDFYVTRLASIRDQSLNVIPGLLNSDKPEVREAAITILRYCESDRAGDHLVEALDDPVPDLAAAAATMLAWRRGSARHVPRLRDQLLTSGDRAPAWGAAVALGRIGGPEAEGALLQALTGPLGPDVKGQVIDSLGMLGTQAAVPLMLDALADDRLLEVLPNSQQSARRAIAALQPDLVARGADPSAALEAASAAPSVAAVAAHWVHLLAGLDAAGVTSRPADRRGPAIQALKRRATSPPAE